MRIIPISDPEDKIFSSERSKYDNDQELEIYLELMDQMKKIDQLYEKKYDKKYVKKYYWFVLNTFREYYLTIPYIFL